MKFIHQGKVITIQYTGDTYFILEPLLEINHDDDDLFFTGLPLMRYVLWMFSSSVKIMWRFLLMSMVV